MSSDEDDELEERAEDLWEMDEVRGGGGTSTVSELDSDEEPADTSDTADISDASDTPVASGTQNAAESSDGDTEAEAESDTADSPDTAGGDGADNSPDPQSADDLISSKTADTSDTADGVDTSDTTATSQSPDNTETAPNSDTSEPSDEAGTTTDSVSATQTTGVSGEVSLAGRQDDPTVRQLWLNAEVEGVTVRDLHNVNVYLYEEVYQEMRRVFKQLDTEHFEIHGEDLSKNKAFFNAVFRAGLESPQLREELELD